MDEKNLKERFCYISKEWTIIFNMCTPLSYSFSVYKIFVNKCWAWSYIAERHSAYKIAAWCEGKRPYLRFCSVHMALLWLQPIEPGSDSAATDIQKNWGIEMRPSKIFETNGFDETDSIGHFLPLLFVRWDQLFLGTEISEGQKKKREKLCAICVILKFTG